MTCFSTILTTYSSFYSLFDNIPFSFMYESVFDLCKWKLANHMLVYKPQCVERCVDNQTRAESETSFSGLSLLYLRANCEWVFAVGSNSTLEWNMTQTAANFCPYLSDIAQDRGARRVRGQPYLPHANARSPGDERVGGKWTTVLSLHFTQTFDSARVHLRAMIIKGYTACRVQINILISVIFVS